MDKLYTIFIIVLYCLFPINGLTQEFSDSEFDELSASTLNASGAAENSQQQYLLGLFVDGQDYGTVTVLGDKNDWFIPISKLQIDSNIGYLETETGVTLTTPSGKFEFLIEDFISFENEIFISVQALNRNLKFEVRFDQSDFALQLYPPWSNRRLSASAQDAIEPDVYPASVSLRQLRAQIDYDSLDENSFLTKQYNASGTVFNGIWELEYVDLENRDDIFNEYRWVTGTENQQIYLGFDQIDPGSLSPGTDLTGVQYAWSNQPIQSNKSRSLEIDNFSQNIAGSARTISGVSEPGAIAQLRINGRIVDEKRTEISGEFSFPRSQLASQDFNNIEVLIFNRQRSRIIERFDFSQQSNSDLLNEGQHLVYGAAGVRGNALSATDSTNDNQVVTAALYRYGFAERLTLEAIVIDDGIDVFKTVGLSTVVAKRLELDAQVSDRGGRQAHTARLRADGDKWRFAASSIQFDSEFRRSTFEKTFQREFDFDYFAADNLILSIAGVDRKTSVSDVSYVLPAASWYNKNWSAQLRPDINEDYRLTARYNRDRFFGQYRYIDNQHFLSVDYRFNPNLNTFANINSGTSDFDLYEVGIDWYPNSTADLDSNVQASVLVNNSGDLGYALTWERSVAPGIFVRTEIENLPPQDILDSENETRFNLQLVFDYAYTGNKFVPGDSIESRLDSGSLSGEILTNGIPIEKFGNLDIISIQIDGVRQEVPLRGRSFFIDLVDTGVHRVKLDNKLLPIELSPDASEAYWVKIFTGQRVSCEICT